jgi:recombination protein RecT
MSAAEALKNATTGQPAQPEVERDPTRRLFRLLEGKQSELKKMLPPSVDIDIFIGVIKTAVLNNPQLADADPRTFFIAATKAAADGLLPDGNEAVFNIYNTKVKDPKNKDREIWVPAVQYLKMLGGLIKKLYASGEVVYIDAAAVYQRDNFQWVRGDNVSLHHEPTMDDDPGPVIAAYCVIKMRNGEIKREVMPRRDIERVRAVSKVPGENGPWGKWYDQMAIKSVIHRIYKQLPHTPELERVVKTDMEETGFTDLSQKPATALPENISHGDTNLFSGMNLRTDAGEAVFSGGREFDISGTREVMDGGGSGPQSSAGSTEGAGEGHGKGADQQGAGADPAALTLAKLLDVMRKRSDPDTLDADASMIGALPEDQREEATKEYKALRAKLTGQPAKAPRQHRIGWIE